MVGPSSSHTAGAARIGLVARGLLAAPPVQAHIELHGSFAATGAGHATDRAIAAGLLGFFPDDPRLRDSRELCKEAGLTLEFSDVDLGEDFHPNTARIRLVSDSGEVRSLVGSSVGGGTIRICEIDDYPTSFGGELESLLLWHHDSPGFLAKVTALLACVEANIATIRTSRCGRGAQALTVIETDAPLPEDCISLLGKISATETVRTLARLP